MAVLYVKNAGGNSNAAATWSNVSSLGVDNSGPPTSSDDCIADLNSGQLTINAALAMKSFSATDGVGDYANTITHNSFTWTVSGNVTFVAGMTYTPTNSVNCAITITGGSFTLTTAGKLMPPVVTNNSSATTLTLGDNYTSMDSKISTLQMSNTSSINMNGKSINGFSSTSRILIKATTLGTARTITNATTSFTNADFRDITFSSASDLDLSAITGLSGDCGGNTITGGGSTLTFTTPATQTATGNSADWSTATWTSRVPLPQDDVVLSLTAGQTLTNDMPRMGKSISVTTGMNLTMSTTNQTIYGSLDLTNVNTFTETGITIFEGRGSFTLTSAGKSFGGAININMINGILTLGDAFSATISNNGVQLLNNGTFVDAGFSIIVARVSVTGSSTRAVTKTGTWTLGVDSSNQNAFNAATITGLTWSDTGTIILNNATSNSNNFIGGGLTFNNLTIKGGGTGPINISGSNTFNTLTVNSPKTLTLTSGTTQTVASFVANGSSGNVITINASTGGSAATLSQSSGTVSCDYLSITDNTATGGALWYAGANSTQGTNVTGWIFTAVPTVVSDYGMTKSSISNHNRSHFRSKAAA